MIATISVKESNKYESISTCRFAQRVALVDNHAHRNKVVGTPRCAVVSLVCPWLFFRWLAW
jgi:hypothetical protein